jgi:uncharacterized cupin superfamily protein
MRESSATPLVHWDDVPSERRAVGHIAASWRRLGDAAGSVGIGLSRIQVDPGMWSTPAHVHGRDEEIFFVLAGSGLLWQDGASYALSPSDCFCFQAATQPHTLKAGPEGLDVLAYSNRSGDAATFLPRAKVSWLGVSWVEAGSVDHPFQRESKLGPPELREPSARRPANLVALKDVKAVGSAHKTVSAITRDLGRAAGSRLTGLRHEAVAPGKLACPPHCHSVEEEIFVVLEGEGTLLLGEEEHPLRGGDIVARPPGSGVAHAFRAGDNGLTLLAYGTRDPGDICFYPRSGKLSFRGVGVIGRLERLDYWDGEE